MPSGLVYPMRAVDRVAQVDLALDIVLPGGGIRIFEIGHEDVRAGVQRVDHHLAFYGPGDLDAPVLEVFRDRRHGPFLRPDIGGLLGKIGQRAAIDFLLHFYARGEKLHTGRFEAPGQFDQKFHRFGSQDLWNIPG